MTKESVIAQRKFLHGLISDRDVTLPIAIQLADGPTILDETDCCFCWNDEEEVVYVVSSNTQYTATTDNRLLPMRIRAVPYDSIMVMYTKADRNILDHFFKEMVDKGLTNEETRKHYFQEMTNLWDPETYLMGQPSPSTEKTPDPYDQGPNLKDLPLKDKPVDPASLTTL